MTRRPRCLFYAVNGLGLGHVTRLLAIARKVRQRLPDAEILFFTSSEAEDVIYREGFAAFKVPSKTTRAATGLRPATYARMLQTVALNLMAAFNPHVLVVDTFPAGILQELLPVLRWDARKVFVYRVQRPEVALSDLMQNTLALYQLALLPHTEYEEDLPLPPGLAALWTGPILIRDRTEAISRAEARARLNLPSDGNIAYITFGGGGDADMDAALATSLAALAPLPSLHLAVARAPLHRTPLPQHPQMTPVSHYPMAELYAAFDVAVSAVGYNSSMEMLHHGLPAVYVPFARQVDDQQARAQRIAQAGAGVSLERLEPEALRTAVTSLLAPQTAQAVRDAAQRLVPANGAERAAEAILNLLE